MGRQIFIVDKKKQMALELAEEGDVTGSVVGQSILSGNVFIAQIREKYLPPPAKPRTACCVKDTGKALTTHATWRGYWIQLIGRDLQEARMLMLPSNGWIRWISTVTLMLFGHR